MGLALLHFLDLQYWHPIPIVANSLAIDIEVVMQHLHLVEAVVGRRLVYLVSRVLLVCYTEVAVGCDRVLATTTRILSKVLLHIPTLAHLGEVCDVASVDVELAGCCCLLGLQVAQGVAVSLLLEELLLLVGWLQLLARRVVVYS